MHCINNESLTESPVRVNSIPTELFDSNLSNYEYTKYIMENGKLVGNYKDYKIYQLVNNNEIIDIFVYSGMSYIYFKYKLNNNIIQEITIWQNQFSLGLFREVMFNYYLDKFDGIISDDVHSIRGENYWKKILNKAKESGFKISVLKNNSVKIPIANINDLDKYRHSALYKFVIEKS
jgi:hypothetical protein